ncbi:PIN domain-containing protein [Phormidesmis priestleyi ULC007]|uniref:PIN domain-containing protein n=2 Tax=Phormidesmis priestleyi TaxID=268141 RepID=A0A2T1DBW3_9CYAN|nr:PIN domain-containing protein [Phormidesmis priestleyi ULC007]PZO53887.1 MAG: PIN domain-containing protein [Phormidesmis priestleyi]
MNFMTDRIFLDTNLWVYVYAKNSIDKTQAIEALIADPSSQLQVSTQVLGELFNVLVRKKFTSQADAANIIFELISDFAVIEIDAPKVMQAIRINQCYGYTYWDSLIVATALLSNCIILYSEDMQHNQLIENQLRILNPFTA